ncbi:MAG: hypothetical protein HY360_15355 [Verrucomicrobia bacterium]|nr:hypothetical protein [Verrucomicrobiota bacterium]
MIARQQGNGFLPPGLWFAGLCLFCFGAALKSPAAEECRTKEVTFQGLRTIEMENDRLLLRVFPSVCGALGDLILKDGRLSTLLPPLDQSEEIIPGTGIRAKGDSMPGLRDWLWPRLPHPFGREFTATADGSDARRAVVSVRAKKDDWEITRTMTLRSGFSMVEVEVAVTYHGRQPETKSYWSHATLRLGGDLLSMPGDDNDLLVIPTRKESSPVQGSFPSR